MYNYIFQPPVNIDDVTTKGLVPTIHVEGDIIRSVSHLKGRQVSRTGNSEYLDGGDKTERWYFLFHVQQEV